MTPAEHYAEADRQLAKIEKLMQDFTVDGKLPEAKKSAALIQTFMEALERQMRLVQVHATLSLYDYTQVPLESMKS